MKRNILIATALLLVVPLLSGCGVAQEDLDTALAEAQAAKSQLASVQSDLTKAKSDLATAKSSLAAAESEAEALQSDLSKAKSDLSTAQGKVSGLQSDLSKAESDLAAAQEQVAALEAAAEEAVVEEEVAEEEEVVEEEVAEEEVAEEEVVELTFTAVTYTNEEYGFSVKYPSTWTEDPAEETGTTVFYAAGPPFGIPGLNITVSDAEEDVSYADGTVASLEGDGGTEVEIVSESETTTADGSAATVLVLSYITSAGDPLDCLAIGAEKDGKFISVFIFTNNVYAPFTEEQMSEVAHTLTLQ